MISTTPRGQRTVPLPGQGASNAMLLLECIAATIAAFSAVPAILFVRNLVRFRPPRPDGQAAGLIAVLVPARDEEQNIRACLACILASNDVQLEVLVYDDGSTDRTASIVAEIAAFDSRVSLLTSVALPAGWNGKQHACWRLANSTKANELLFLDADVRLEPGTIVRCAAARRSRDVALLSGFPRQITSGILEKMLLPLINFVLLSFLPMGRMRNTTKPAYAAGCGQFFLVDRGPYFACGGHSSVRQTRHDGLMLPRLFREHGYRTDLVDLTELAQVRMYDTPSAVWQGLAKNATEGLAAPKRIVPFTLLLFFGQVLPGIAVVCWGAVIARTTASRAALDVPQAATVVSLLLALAVLSSFGTRLLAAARFRQSLMGALLHPVGVMLLIVVQWYALVKQMLGKPVMWRTRSYSGGTGPQT